MYQYCIEKLFMFYRYYFCFFRSFQVISSDLLCSKNSTNLFVLRVSWTSQRLKFLLKHFVQSLFLYPVLVLRKTITCFIVFLFRGYTIRTHKVKYNQSLKWNFDSHLQKREKCFCSNIMFLHCTLCKKKISQEKNWFYKIHELLAKFSLFTHKKKSGLCCV